MDAEREQEGGKGYAIGFEGLVGHIGAWTPSNEVLGPAFRSEIPMFPPVAIRELVANALIHQDFTITGAGPMIEIFDRRLEISNPGEPLIDTRRFLDTQPRSRNEKLASLMRRLNICEERGTGIDKVVHARLPSPCDPAAHDEFFLASALRDRRQECLDCVTSPRRCRGRGVDCGCRPGGGSPLATIPAVLGTVMIQGSLGSNSPQICLIRNPPNRLLNP